MLIFPTWEGIPDEFLGKMVLFDMDETKKARGGIEIKPEEHYVNIGFSNDNHAPIFLGLVVGEHKGTLRVASTGTHKKLDSFLSDYVSKKNQLIQEIENLKQTLSELDDLKELKSCEISDLRTELRKVNNRLEKQHSIFDKRKKMIDKSLSRNFHRWIDSSIFLRILYWLYEKR
ncbi:hypothetical protein [Streptococcus intermedius]|mgnify:CR=1 FL=1|uniref:hypothetical protein n=1 Tax=Streptococcus intermedius TaxID=1338 RepID=UPI00039091CE|nr:hypothetical protein [Streptococcus intermedius]AGU78946.1 hypothetical protein SII_1804 [Streptococcus intermedius C270]